MSAEDEDSQMLSSPDESDIEPVQQTTPKETVIDHSTLSPPDSAHGGQRTMPIVASGAHGANSNGKRPINTISNGNDDMEELAAMANGKARQDDTMKIHQPSGYSWNRIEDEPGYAWLNKKAMDEMNRAWDGLVHKEFAVGNRYGDPFEAVEREQAIVASLK